MRRSVCCIDRLSSKFMEFLCSDEVNVVRPRVVISN
jgi:hypothetical protein